MEQGTKNMVTFFGFVVLSALFLLSLWASVSLMQDVRRIESMVLKSQVEIEAIRRNTEDLAGVVRGLETELDSMRTLIGDAAK